MQRWCCNSHVNTFIKLLAPQQLRRHPCRRACVCVRGLNVRHVSLHARQAKITHFAAEIIHSFPSRCSSGSEERRVGKSVAGQGPVAEQAKVPLRQPGVATQSADWRKNPVIQVLADSVNKIHWHTVDGLGYSVQVLAPCPPLLSETSHDRCHPT